MILEAGSLKQLDVILDRRVDDVLFLCPCRVILEMQSGHPSGAAGSIRPAARWLSPSGSGGHSSSPPLSIRMLLSATEVLKFFRPLNQ